MSKVEVKNPKLCVFCPHKVHKNGKAVCIAPECANWARVYTDTKEKQI